jgi:hypothetical protein
MRTFLATLASCRVLLDTVMDMTPGSGSCPCCAAGQEHGKSMARAQHGHGRGHAVTMSDNVMRGLSGNGPCCDSDAGHGQPPALLTLNLVLAWLPPVAAYSTSVLALPSAAPAQGACDDSVNEAHGYLSLDTEIAQAALAAGRGAVGLAAAAACWRWRDGLQRPQTKLRNRHRHRHRIRNRHRHRIRNRHRHRHSKSTPDTLNIDIDIGSGVSSPARTATLSGVDELDGDAVKD